MKKYNAICINGTSLTKQITGIERYVNEILKHIDRIVGQDVKIQVLVPECSEIYCSPFRNMEIVKLKENKNHKLKISEIRKHLKKIEGLYCSLSGNLCIQKGALICIHDIRPWIYSEYDPLLFRLRCAVNFLSAKLFAGHIITVSKTSYDEIERYLHVCAERISVIYDSWDHIKDTLEDDSIWERHPELKKGEYFYSLSSQAPHKNFRWVLENAKVNPDITFAIAGKKWANFEMKQIPDNVIYLGYVSDEENKSLMTNCRAFIHPSRYEGFGLTPLEALACGAQILVSDCSCMPEIFSSCATLIDPDDYHFDFSRIHICTETDREKLLQNYSWESSAQKWLDIFKKYVD